jgi:hypothetical protein
MIINYKEPYWIKYEWDLNEHKDHQYVTEFNKSESKKISNLFHQLEYSINIEFKLDKDLESDNIFCIFGKPGKNFGLTYNHEADTLALEFWTEATTKVADDEFHYLPFHGVNYDEISNGIVITIVRKNDEFIIYKNFEKVGEIDFDKNLIDDYRTEGLYLGTGNPGTEVPEHRYHGSVDIDNLLFVEDITDIETIKKIYKTDINNLNKIDEYNKVIFNYDFNTVNNQGIIYDNSKNTYFVEKVPTEFIK